MCYNDFACCIGVSVEDSTRGVGVGESAVGLHPFQEVLWLAWSGGLKVDGGELRGSVGGNVLKRS